MEALEVAHHRLNYDGFFIAGRGGFGHHGSHKCGQDENSGKENGAAGFHKLMFTPRRSGTVRDLGGVEEEAAKY
jgi:hypothetical protein